MLDEVGSRTTSRQLVFWRLFPATTSREKISFHQLNKETGNRIRYLKVDAESGDQVPSEDIIKGYEVAKGEYVELDPEELESVAIESKRTIEIDEFVAKKEIDELYMRDPMMGITLRRFLYAKTYTGPIPLLVTDPQNMLASRPERHLLIRFARLQLGSLREASEGKRGWRGDQ